MGKSVPCPPPPNGLIHISVICCFLTQFENYILFEGYNSLSTAAGISRLYLNKVEEVS